MDAPTELTPAERLYLAHSKAVKKYQMSHPEQCKEKARRFYERVKNVPELLAEAQAKRRKYYLEVALPKRRAAQAARRAEKDATFCVAEK